MINVLQHFTKDFIVKFENVFYKTFYNETNKVLIKNGSSPKC